LSPLSQEPTCRLPRVRQVERVKSGDKSRMLFRSEDDRGQKRNFSMPILLGLMVLLEVQVEVFESLKGVLYESFYAFVTPYLCCQF